MSHGAVIGVGTACDLKLGTFLCMCSEIGALLFATVAPKLSQLISFVSHSSLTSKSNDASYLLSLAQMKRARITYWDSGGGDGDTAAVLARALKPHAGDLASLGTSLYSSMLMSGTPFVEQLAQSSGLLTALVRVDSRGGLFRQGDMADAYSLVLASEGLTATFAANSDLALSPADQIGMASYKLRVMRGRCLTLTPCGDCVGRWWWWRWWCSRCGWWWCQCQTVCPPGDVGTLQGLLRF